MSFTGLLNKRCSWIRSIMTGQNDYREPIYTDTTMGTNVPCRLEEIEAQTLWEAEPGGDFTRAKYLLYMEPTDIKGNDRVTIDGSDNYKVQVPDPVMLMDHHFEVRLEKTVDL